MTLWIGRSPRHRTRFSTARAAAGRPLQEPVQQARQKRPNSWGLHDVIGNRWHRFWRAGAGSGDDSTNDHIVYGGTFHTESGGNRARLANIMISDQPEGARFALIPAGSPVPSGHPVTRPQTKVRMNRSPGPALAVRYQPPI